MLGRSRVGTRLVPVLVACGLGMAGLWGWRTGYGLLCRSFSRLVRVFIIVGTKDRQVPASRTGIVGTHWVTVGETLFTLPLRSGKRSPVAEENKGYGNDCLL